MQLKQGCSADERDKNGSTALMHAIWHATPGTGYFDVVELLVEAGADVNVRACASSAPTPLVL